MKVTNKDYLAEIEILTEKMIAAEDWANTMPLFKETILKNKFNANMSVKYGENYKSLPLSWGIRRHLYTGDNGRNVTNYTKPHSGYYWNLYINTYSLFNMSKDLGLREAVANMDIFFFDELNATIYCTDAQIEDCLEALHNWYLVAKKEAAFIVSTKRQQELEKELARLKNQKE